MEEIILALELAQNQIAASRDMCSEDEGELWDIYQAAINKARSSGSRCTESHSPTTKGAGASRSNL